MSRVANHRNMCHQIFHKPSCSIHIHKNAIDDNYVTADMRIDGNSIYTDEDELYNGHIKIKLREIQQSTVTKHHIKLSLIKRQISLGWAKANIGCCLQMT